MGNWSALSPDLLVSIAERLSVPDYARFRAVCTSWSSTMKDFVPTSSSNFPWLALVADNDHIQLSFLNLLEDRFYRISLPERLHCVGHKEGWLVTVGRHGDILVLNPLTGARSHLPPLSTLPYNLTYRLSDSIIQKVVLSDTPSSPGGFIAVICYGFDFHHCLAFSRPGDDKWTRFYSLKGDIGFANVVYHDGRFFAVCAGGQLLAFDLAGPSATVSYLARTSSNNAWSTCSLHGIFLVSAPSGDLLQIRMERWNESWDSDMSLTIVKFDPENDKWVESKDLGGCSLFLDLKECMMLSDVPGLKEDCIFLTDRCFDVFKKKLAFAVGVYDVRESTTKSLFCRNTLFDCLSFRAPIWFKPSLS